MSKYFLIISALFSFLVLDVHVGHSKKIKEPSESKSVLSQAQSNRQNLPTSSDNVVFSDENIKVTMSSEGDVTEGAKNYEAYNLHFQNLSNKPLKVKGDVVNRVSRKNFTRTQTSQRSVSRSRRPFSVGLGYGPLMLVAGSGGFGVANPITGGIIGARREQAYSSPISAKISRLSPDGVMNRQVLPKSSFDFRYMLPAGSTGDEKLAFNYSVGSELSKSFHKGMTKAEADTIASVTPVKVATQTKAASANSLACNPKLLLAIFQKLINSKESMANQHWQAKTQARI
jgi:hypothetical protein